jgi:hypothetical protein
MAETINWPRDFREATTLPASQVAIIVEALINELDRREDDIEAEPGTWTENLNGRRRKGNEQEDTGVEDAREGFDPECDFGAEEYGEEEHRSTGRYGLDQTRPIGPDNPEVR